MSLGHQKEQYRLLDQLGQEATGLVRQLPEKMRHEKGWQPKGATRVLVPPGQAATWTEAERRFFVWRK